MAEASDRGLGREHPVCAECPVLGDQAEALLAAIGAEEMKEAAERLRLRAVSVERLLSGSLSSRSPIQFDPSVSDPEQRRAELTDLAIDVVTAVDYLLSLLRTSVETSSRFILADDVRSDAGNAIYDRALDRLTRQRLDARGATVRLGMRLLRRLGCDVAYQPIDASRLAAVPRHCVMDCPVGRIDPPQL